MKSHPLLYLIIILLASCSAKGKEEVANPFQNAQWIAYEQLADSLKIIPAVHGEGNHLDNRGLKRSIVPLFRKEFNTSAAIKHASISICGLGHYELYINGAKIGDRFLAPGWSLYQKRSLFNTYDITENINKGDNVIGVIVGNGFYNINRERYRKFVVAYGYPRLIFNLKLEMQDGTIKNIISDSHCKVSPSAITFSSIYGGEDYDARLEQTNWNNIDFDDTQWQHPVILNNTIGQLVPEEDYPLKIMQIFESQEVLTSKTGRIIFDFGQNASGIISLKVKGNRGAKITIRPDELINEEGNITQKSGGGPYSFSYTLKGQGVEVWQPRFTYYGFRYADVEIIEPEDAALKTEILKIKMLHTRNSSPSVGSFECSDTLFNQIYNLINWGIKSNMASVTTDCPHREKLGWLEQTYLIGPSMHYNFDISKLYNKIVNDMIDSQLDNGLVPDIAPEYVPFGDGFRDSPEWGSASIIIPWQLYKWYNNFDVLKKAYPMMRRYIDYLHSKSDENILYHGLGDWYDLGPNHPGVAQLTPKAVTASSIYYYDLIILSKIAKLLNKKSDVRKYQQLAKEVKTAFQLNYYNPKTGVCSTGSQTAYAMALYTGILPERDKDKVLHNLIDSIAHNDYALTAGDIGYHFLVRVLSENGRSDVLYKMNSRNDRPGYGYQLKKGATSLTESWAALPNASNNHMMLGHLMEWFYSGLGGIYQAENSIAYAKIIIAPKPVGNINWVKSSYHSTRGIISSEWKINGSKFHLKIEVPKDADAKVIIPSQYREIGCTVKDLKENKILDIKTNAGIFDLVTGKYEIITK